MAASASVCDYVRHSSRPFIFSASITPASCATAIAALNQLVAHPELVTKLQHISTYFRNQLVDRGIKIRKSETPIIPIYTYETIDTLTVARQLYDEGVYVNSSLPPATAPHECLLRTSLMATHTEAIVEKAANIIHRVLKANGICK